MYPFLISLQCAVKLFNSDIVIVVTIPDQDDGDGGMEPEVEGEAEVEGQGEVEVEMESDGELHDADPVHGESEGERDQSSQEVEVGDQREESEGKDSESDEKEDYGHRVVTSRRRDVIESGSERSEENRYADNEDEEVDQARSPRYHASFSLFISLSPPQSKAFIANLYAL